MNRIFSDIGSIEKSHTVLILYELTTMRLLGSIVMIDSCLHFLQYPGKLIIVVSFLYLIILGKPQFGHAYQYSAFNYDTLFFLQSMNLLQFKRIISKFKVNIYFISSLLLLCSSLHLHKNQRISHRLSL